MRLVAQAELRSEKLRPGCSLFLAGELRMEQLIIEDKTYKRSVKEQKRGVESRKVAGNKEEAGSEGGVSAPGLVST